MAGQTYGIGQALAEIERRYGERIPRRTLQRWLKEGKVPDAGPISARAYAIPESSLEEIVKLRRREGA